MDRVETIPVSGNPVTFDCLGKTMQIHGPTFVHGAQSINAPHRNAAPQAAPQTSYAHEADSLDISPQASLASQLRDIPDIRADRVAQIKAQIASGTYETEAKLNGALEGLLNELA